MIQNKAAAAAAAVLDRYLAQNPFLTMVFGPTRQLYEQVVLIAHRLADYKHPNCQLLEFQQAFGSDIRGQNQAIDSALLGAPRLTIAVVDVPMEKIPQPQVIRFKVLPCGVHTGDLSVPEGGLALIFPTEFVAGVADYCRQWQSGEELIPLQFSHTVEGEQEDWARLEAKAKASLGW